MKNLTIGILAGAVGTTALNIATYTDMALRGRAASSTPAEVVRKLAQQLGDVPLGKPDEQSDDVTKNRRTALGSLSGYGVGLGVGVVYVVIRPLFGALPTVVKGLVVGALAMAASDVPATRLGVTDASTWTPSDWAGDILPHAIYGIATASVVDALIRN